jgi:hypothetical protein
MEALLNRLALKRLIFKQKKGFANLSLGLICYSIASSQPLSRDTVLLSKETYSYLSKKFRSLTNQHLIQIRKKSLGSLWIQIRIHTTTHNCSNNSFQYGSTTEQRTRIERGVSEISFYLVQAWEYYEMSELGYPPPPLLPATSGGGGGGGMRSKA